MRLSAVLIFLCLAASTSQAHRLDECLQAALISITPDQIRIELNLTPGVEVAPAILALIDLDKDGMISEREGRSYAGRLMKDILLSLDDKPLKLTLGGSWFSPVEEMRAGLGRIRLELACKAAAGKPGEHHLDFMNSHQPALSQYLVNALLPPNDAIRIEKQIRDEFQRGVRVEFKTGDGAAPEGTATTRRPPAAL